MISPLALATLGIGFVPSVSARIGLWDVPVSQSVRVKKGKGNVVRKDDDEDIDTLFQDDEDMLAIIRVFMTLRGQ